MIRVENIRFSIIVYYFLINKEKGKKGKNTYSCPLFCSLRCSKSNPSNFISYLNPLMKSHPLNIRKQETTTLLYFYTLPKLFKVRYKVIRCKFSHINMAYGLCIYYSIILLFNYHQYPNKMIE